MGGARFDKYIAIAIKHLETDDGFRVFAKPGAPPILRPPTNQNTSIGVLFSMETPERVGAKMLETPLWY